MIRVQVGQPADPQGERHEENPGPQVRPNAGMGYVVDGTTGEVTTRGVTRYQAGAFTPARDASDYAGILATARTASGHPVATITEDSIVHIPGLGNARVKDAIRGGLLPHAALTGGIPFVPATPISEAAPPLAQAAPADPQAQIERNATERLSELPAPLVSRIISKMTDGSGTGLDESDFAAAERAGMSRADFEMHAVNAIAGFQRQARAIIAAMGVEDSQALVAWANENAKVELWNAIRENVAQGTDLRFTALIQRYKQR